MSGNAAQEAATPPTQGVNAATDRVRCIYDKLAPNYDQTMNFWDRLFFRNSRRWVCSQAHGQVLEVAIGTGRNLPFYGEDVHLTGIDLSPAMLEIARRRAGHLRRTVELCVGDAQALAFPDNSFDAVVFTLALCTIPDDRRAVAEAKRVVRPGGRVVLLEHVRSPNLLVRSVQRTLNLCTVRFQADHQLREPLAHIVGEGFAVEQIERLRGGWVERLSARKPS